MISGHAVCWLELICSFKWVQYLLKACSPFQHTVHCSVYLVLDQLFSLYHLGSWRQFALVF
jgi:hypothetical protein